MSAQEQKADLGEIPDNANEGCVGPTSESAGKASACAGCPMQASCSSGKFNNKEAAAQKQAEQEEIKSALSGVSQIVLILSGKGGVGKSTVACQLAHTLSQRGYNVGLLDVDLCGPSAPRMCGVVGREVHKSAWGWTPVYASENLSVMSISFLLPDADAAVVWRGPRKNGLIKQFLTETDWSGGGGDSDDGGIDYLIVDTPPGTSDEHISTVQYLQAVGGVGGAIVVTTPEEVSMADVRKELNFCKKTNIKVLGVLENMATFKTTVAELKFMKRNPRSVGKVGGFENGKKEELGDEKQIDCTEEILRIFKERCPEVLDLTVGADVFPPSHGGPAVMAKNYNVPFLGSLPLDPNLLKACEEGVCFVEEYKGSAAVGPMNALADGLVETLPVDFDVLMDDSHLR